MDIGLTRELVEAALSGALDRVEYDEDRTFHLMVPRTCPNIPDPAILNPRNTWRDKQAFDNSARRLAAEFCARFDRSYGAKGIAADVVRQCPGK